MSRYKKPTLDKDLDKISYMEEAATSLGRGLMAPGAGLLFIVLCGILAGAYVIGAPSGGVIVAASAIGAYMALNIGANDVANNVGPAVGAKAMSLTSALVIAAICESAGALLAGGDVVDTISMGIIDPAAVADTRIFTAAMMAALVSAALWINLATWFGAPVSTTHAIVGGVMGAGIAASGFSSVNWLMLSGIAMSWVISPLVGGVVAAFFLWIIKAFIVYQDDKIAAARRWVPILIAVMAGTFAAYLAVKGVSHVVTIELSTALVAGGVVAVLAWMITRPLIARQSRGLENRNQSLRKLFAIPLVCSAALLSFAHGANDVANAVGPLAAIVHTAEFGDVAESVAIPLWVMAVGALGISFGLLLFGPRLINMVGRQITKLNPMRAYCVALSAATTVIIASGFGMPVSSTHIAVGAVFGVGFFREWYTERSERRLDFLNEGEGGKARRVRPVRNREEQARRKLVRRAHFMTTIAAWMVTVPASAILSGILFFLMAAIL
ncbi:inorganic phosphate transporter [Labrenzia sp. CE80]|uniref:inorganic phosphate transporter n=1 Tax=Labrenzia sp. CE80 TaxID=1788986 RepID=UPI00129B1A92|nr:inorganic phosphate transporter [Labrenzia sp. CE80]